MNIAEKLVAGSHEIDRRRKIIDECVALLIGFLKPELEGIDLVCSSVEFNGYWKVEKTAVREFSSPIISVRCYLRVAGHYVTTYDSADSNIRPTLRDVEGTYDGLPVLVRNISTAFPHISAKWKPLLEAAGTLG